MGGCSSKPETAECNEGLLFHTALKTSDSSSHQTLESLFNQHGRDGEHLLEDAQTLHELLLHAVNSKELPDFENQSAGNTEARALQSDLNSPLSVLSHAAEKNASTCTNVEGSLPNSEEVNGAKMESFVHVTEENAKKCTHTEGIMPNLAEGNHQEKGASNLEGSQSGLPEEKRSNMELMLLALPEENVENCSKVESFMSNVAAANPRKLEGFVPNLAEVKLEEECPKSTGALSNFAEENAIKLESESSPESLNSEPKSDLPKISVSTSSECADYKTRGLYPGPKSDVSKIPEPSLIEGLTTDIFQRIKAADAAMETNEANVESLNEIAMTADIKREVQDEIAMETGKTPKQDETSTKNEKALQGVGTEEQLGKATEGEETKNAVDDKKTEMQCEKALEIEKDKISQGGEKAELQNEKAMEGELPKVQFESGGMSLATAMEDDTLPQKTEKAKVDLQDEKEWKTGMQNERIFDGEVERIQRAEDDEQTVPMEKLENVQDAEEKESQEEKKTGVQDDETRVQAKKVGLEDEETEMQHEERAEDEKAMAHVSLLHVKAEDEEAKEDVPSSPVNQSFTFTSDLTHAKDTVVDSCFEPLITGSEQSIVAIHSGPSLAHASKENTAETAELGLINESDQKFSCKDNTADVVANFGLTEKLEVDLKNLVSDENTIEAVGPEDIENLEFEQKKAGKAEHIERTESSNEAVTGCELTKLCNNVKALDDGQSQSTDSEQIRHIERHEKLEHDILHAPQHSEGNKLDDKKNVEATILEESSIEAAMGISENSNLVQVAGEKGDAKSASEVCAYEEKIPPEALEEQSMHEGNARDESSNIECLSKLVVENDTKDDSDKKVKMEVSGEEEHGFVQKDHVAEKLQCGHIQMPIQELDLITSKGVESHTQAQAQAHDESVLSSFPESSVQENLSSPTVVEIGVEKRVTDISSSSLSAAEKTFIECVESKPRIKTSGEGIDDDANDMEASKQCGEKGEGLKPAEEL